MNRFRRLFAVIFITGLLIACNDGMSDSQHLTKAREYLKKGQLNAASIELKNALQKNPDNPLIRMELGKLHLKSGNIAAAEKELSKALSLGVENERVLPSLARSMLYQGKHAEVMALSLTGLSAKSKSEVLALQGLSLIAQGDITKANITIEKAMDTGDVSLHAMVANAGLLGYSKEFDKSRKQLEAVIEIDPEFAPAWSLLGDIETNEGKYESALDAYTKAISLRVNNMPDMLKRTMILLQLKQYDNAQKDISQLKNKIPLHPGFNYAQGIIHFQNKKYQDAQAAFDLALVDEKRYPMALYYAGLTNYLLGQHERAEKYTTQHFTKSPEFTPTRKLLALIQMSNHKYKEAEELIRPLVETDEADVGAMNILASTLLNQGKTNESIDLLSKIVEINPDSPEAQTRLGVGLMLSGDNAAGEEHLSAAAKLDSSNIRGEILLILNYSRQKQFDKALESAKALKEKHPKKVVSYNVLGRVYQQIGKKQEAVDTFAMVLEMEPGNPSATQNLAAMAISDKDFAKARNYYLEALKKHNKHLAILMNMAALNALESNEKSMIDYLQQAIEYHPAAVQPRLILARYYLTKGENEQVAFLVRQFDQTQMKTPSVLELVSLSKLAKGDYEGAKDTLKQYLKLKPTSAQAHHRLANAYAGMNQLKGMRAELEKSIELAPDYFPARLDLAKLFLSLRENDLVAQHMPVLNRLAPNHPEVQKIEVSLALREGNLDKALELAEAVHKAVPSTNNLIMLSRIKWNMNDHDGAVQLYNEWLARNPDDVDVRLALGGRYLVLEKQDAAIEQYKKTLLIDENNIIALNNLAWYLRDTDIRKALEYARYANSVEPKSPALMDTLAMVLLTNNEIDEAKRIIKEAMIKAPTNPSIQYHGAKIYAAAGDKAEAVVILNKIVEGDVPFQEKKDALELLKELKLEAP